MVNLNISNQNNGCIDQTLHHDTIGTKGAVVVLYHQVHHILSSGGSKFNFICNLFDNKQWMSIQSSEIVSAVIVVGKSLNLQSHRIDPDLIRSHFLQTGGDMVLKVMESSDSTIKKFVRYNYHIWNCTPTFIQWSATKAFLKKLAPRSLSTIYNLLNHQRLKMFHFNHLHTTTSLYQLSLYLSTWFTQLTWCYHMCILALLLQYYCLLPRHMG